MSVRNPICNNANHIKWMEELAEQTMFCNNHPGAPEYSGGKFKRCPFCSDKKTKSKTLNKIPHRCPVCNGTGMVPNGFYTQTTGHWGSTNITPEKCRSCDGTGVVWERNDDK